MSYATNNYQSSNYGRRVQRNEAMDHLATRESIQQPNKGRTRQKRGKCTPHSRIIARVCSDIVNTIRDRHQGFLHAANFKDAVGQLFRQTKHSKEFIKQALRKLTRGDILREDTGGYKLMVIR